MTREKKPEPESAQTSPFGFLHGSIRVLVADDDPHVTQLYGDLLGKCPFYEVFRARDAVEAESMLKEFYPVHVCLLDLGLRERENDQFYLLRRFGLDTVVIIVSGSDSLEMGYVAASLGARGTIHKTDLRQMMLVERINEKFLESIVLPGSLRDDSGIVTAADAMKRYEINTVREWSVRSGVEEAYLEERYATVSKAPPETRLLLYRLYKAALTDKPADTASARADFGAQGKAFEGVSLRRLYRTTIDWGK